MRGWGCELPGDVAVAVGGGSALLLLFLAVVPGALYCASKPLSSMRARTQWVTIWLFPAWLAWFVWCTSSVLRAKSDGYRQLNFIAGFTVYDLGDTARCAALAARTPPPFPIQSCCHPTAGVFSFMLHVLYPRCHTLPESHHL